MLSYLKNMKTIQSFESKRPTLEKFKKQMLAETIFHKYNKSKSGNINLKLQRCEESTISPVGQKKTF